MELKLKDKIAIVTGAGQGIGRAIALEFAKAGAKVVLAEIREDTTERVRKEIEGMGKEVLAVPTDVSRRTDVKRMVEKTIERFGQVDILVNNAGIAPKRMIPGKGGVRISFSEMDDEHWDSVMNTNLKGVFYCCQAVIPFLIKQRSGKIVNISSVTGLTGGAGSPASAAYCSSKAGVICLTKVLARELAPYNINVNNVAPAGILTDLSGASSPETLEGIRRNTPLGRFGKPEDIARGVLFLASVAGGYMTGETMLIDGGRVMY